MDNIRTFWADMFTPPWHATEGTSKDRYVQVLLWLCGWFWSILGLILGAFLAPDILGRVGLANTQPADWLTYGIVALSALVVQLASFGAWALLFFAIAVLLGMLLAVITRVNLDGDAGDALGNAAFAIVALLSIGGESYALYRFIQTQNLAQGTATTYALGGLVVKAILFPAIKGFLVGVIAKRFFRWVRGEDNKA